MDWKLILTIVQIVSSLVLGAIVLLQQGKSAGLSGAIAGGAETFFGKNKGRTIEAALSKWTSIVAIIFLACSFTLSFLVG